MEQELSSYTKQRKADHLAICLKQQVESQTGPGFDDVILVHQSVPDINFSSINISIELFEKSLAAPLIIEGMTGGVEQAKPINHTIAAVCEKKGVGMGVGSQRAMIEDSALVSSYMVRVIAPHIVLIGNVGLPQIVRGYSRKEADAAVKGITADCLAVHLNPLQEAVQPEGDTDFESGVTALKTLKKAVEYPVIAKETGAGISKEICQKLSFLDGIDVGGLGGTSFSAVEYYRNTGNDREIAAEFWNWGIPTAVSIVECKSAPLIIASGGIRTGIDMAKAIALGADCCGIALPALKAAVQSEKALHVLVDQLCRELKIAMFLCGCKTIAELKRAPVVIMGKTREYLTERGYKTELFAQR